MDDQSCECAAINIKRLADCTGHKASDLFEKLIHHGILTAQESAEMAKYFDYDD